jgi:hypothetical protein
VRRLIVPSLGDASVAAAWVVSRLFVLWLLWQREHIVVGDPAYYAASIQGLGSAGVAHTLVEYPVPALLLLALPYWALQAAGHVGDYTTAIAVCAAAIDLMLGVALLRSGHRTAQWFWVLAVPAVGATAYARFDLIPGVLVALAILYAATRPRVAAAMGTLAAGVKYWPAIVLPAVLAPRRRRSGTLVSALITGAVLALGSLALGGWHRLWTPLSYLHGRGLQIESITATPAMVKWAREPDLYSITYASSKSYEIAGPGTDGILLFSTLLVAAFALILIVLWALAWRTPELSPDAVVWLVLASVSGFIVTGKVFSPQYVLWLLPGAAAGLAVLRDAESRRRLLLWSLALLAVTVATQLIFPLRYGDLLAHNPNSMATVLLLAVRNVGMLLISVYAVLEAFSLLWVREPAALEA